MATFTGLGKSQNGGQSCKNFTNIYFSPVPPCKPTSIYPNSMVLIEKRENCQISFENMKISS